MEEPSAHSPGEAGAGQEEGWLRAEAQRWARGFQNAERLSEADQVSGARSGELAFGELAFMPLEPQIHF